MKMNIHTYIHTCIYIHTIYTYINNIAEEREVRESDADRRSSWSNCQRRSE